MAEDCWLQARLYLGLEHSPNQQDDESLCFSILVGHGQSHTFRVGLATDLAIWEKSFQRAVFLEVQRIRVSIWTGISGALLINKKLSVCVATVWKCTVQRKEPRTKAGTVQNTVGITLIERVKNTTQLHKFALAKYEVAEWPLLLRCCNSPSQIHNVSEPHNFELRWQQHKWFYSFLSTLLQWVWNEAIKAWMVCRLSP